MLIAGFQKMTLLDYPEKIAALVFTQGCNFACGYCHNPEMIPTKRVLPYRSELEPEAILHFLSKRKGLLDGVVISGGEPTLQSDLGDFMKHIKSQGFLVKLDTNGSHPEILKKIFQEKLVDYIAMDVKHSAEGYQSLVKNDCAEAIQTSINLIKDSGVDYEFRSTILPSVHLPEHIRSMGGMIRGAKRWCLQNFRSFKTLDRKLADQPSFRKEQLEAYRQIAQGYAKLVEVRGD
jgi:pyruvate formate lyase activating enzyme